MTKKLIYQPFEQEFIAWTKTKDVTLFPGCYHEALTGKKVFRVLMQQNRSSRGTIVFAHGTGNSAFYPFISLFKILLNEGFSVYIFDLDGHGRNSSTILYSHLLSDCLDRAYEDLINTSTHPVNSVHLIGHSLGGTLALQSLRGENAAQWTSSVIISAPTTLKITGYAAFSEIVHTLNKHFFHESTHYGITGLLPAVGPFKRNSFPIRMPKGLGGFSYVKTVAQYIDSLTLTKILATSLTPTLLIYGERDFIAPPSQAHQLVTTFPTSKLVTIPHANHFTTVFDPHTKQHLVDWFHSFL